MPEDTPLELNPEWTPIYRFARGLLRLVAKVLFRPQVSGVENIPLEGPVLIAPIHRSNVDFAFTLFISRRKVFFMAKDSLFKVPLLGPVLRRLGAFPVRRGSADRESMSLATEVLRRGEALVLFPEGTRKFGLTVEPLQDGAMFIAGRTGATVVPVGIWGSEDALPPGARLPRPVKIKIVVGQPLSPPTGEGRVSRSAVTQKSEELRRALEAVYREARDS